MRREKGNATTSQELRGEPQRGLQVLARLFEKIALIVVTVAIIPFMVGQLSYVFAVLAILVSFIFVLIIAMVYLSRKIWYLPKDDSKSKSREAKNE